MVEMVVPRAGVHTGVRSLEKLHFGICQFCCCFPLKEMKWEVRLFSSHRASLAVPLSRCFAAQAGQPRGPTRVCADHPELANCALVLQAQLCGNEYYSSFCCSSCSRAQPHAQPIWQQG